MSARGCPADVAAWPPSRLAATTLMLKIKSSARSTTPTEGVSTTAAVCDYVNTPHMSGHDEPAPRSLQTKRARHADYPRSRTTKESILHLGSARAPKLLLSRRQATTIRTGNRRASIVHARVRTVPRC